MGATLLVVDDSDAARASMRRTLEEADLDLRFLEAADGAEALALALGGEVDIVLSDVVMPKLDGLQLLRALRQHRDANSLPVILITSRDDSHVRETSFDAGVNDYLTKPFSALELVSRIKVQLRLRSLQEELGRATELQRVMGAHDELTGLANRRHFFELCRRELVRSRRHRLPMSVAVLDAAGVREINERAGYVVGDAVVGELALVLAHNLRSTDVLARLGGEKLAVLLPQADVAHARLVCTRLCEAVRAHAFPQQPPGVVTLAAGGATYPTAGIESVDELLNAAEASLDRAVERGAGAVELWAAPAETETETETESVGGGGEP